ncbi:MAG: hypothetical protein KF729_11170 [Sandaracinaceae bacterium]|nr:hypothetical protein [Sandaracinaceae bacterium]
MRADEPVRVATLAVGLICLALACAPSARAQDDAPPEEAPALPPGHPPAPAEASPAPAPSALPPGHPAPTGGTVAPGAPASMQRILQPPAPEPAVESADVPTGTIRVLVVDEAGEPVGDQPVDVGILAGGARDRRNGRTGLDGVAVFSDLATGGEQHYRVNVPYRGATYSTMPFSLAAGGSGYSVRVVRRPVTEDDQFVFFHVFRTIVEQRGERMHVIHQGELTNAGTETFAFPADGVRARLPEGALAFQFQRVMTDQRIEEIAGEHAYALRGSLPPGTVRLAWAYDVPIEGGDMSLAIDLPMAFFGMQVIVEAVPGLEISVAGMPRPERLDAEGRPCESSMSSEGCAWIAHIQRSPTDARLERIVIRIRGIPGPGPTRVIAVALLVLFAVGGVLLLLSTRGTGSDAEARAARREEIRAEAAELAEELEAGDVGPEYAKRRRAELMRELANLYYADEIATARDEADDERSRVRRHAPGPVGLLAPAKDAEPAARWVELALTALAAPLLLLPVAFVAVRPTAARAMRGMGEVALVLVLGLAGGALVWVVGDLVASEATTARWAVLAVSGAALALRTVVRHAGHAAVSPAGDARP